MIILLSAYACEPNKGTEEGFGWNWATNLAQIGHEVWVLTRPNGRQSIEKAMQSADLPNLHFIYIENKKGIVERTLRYVRLDWQYLYVVWQLQALATAKKLDREVNFDLVHHVSWGSITAGSWLWLLKKPFIFGPVGGGQVAPASLKKYFLNQWKHEALRSQLSKSLAKINFISCLSIYHADLVLVTNSDTYKLAQKLRGQKVELFLDSGLPKDFFPPELPIRTTASSLRLLWVGSPVIRKGLRLSLEALAQVDSSIPLEITILGIDPAEQSLIQSVRELGLANRVNCLGRLPWTEVRNEYLRNDIFFFTSLRDSFGSQFLEAMATGLPIITLDHQGAKDFIPKTAGIKVPVKDPIETVNSLARAIEYAYYNPQELVAMGQAGYEFAKTQIWSNKVNSITSYYEELFMPQQQLTLKH